MEIEQAKSIHSTVMKLAFAVEGIGECCYDAAIEKNGYAKPDEPKKEIVDDVIKIMNQHSQTVILK
jgi:hypothetical protein